MKKILTIGVALSVLASAGAAAAQPRYDHRDRQAERQYERRMDRAERQYNRDVRKAERHYRAPPTSARKAISIATGTAATGCRPPIAPSAIAS
jgi:type II secretory pathway pseudopilin PulG